MGKVVRTVALVSLAALMLALVPASALAGQLTRWSEKQTVAGLTQRTIWSQCQVAVYRLPRNVTHVGTVHVELTYRPADRDCYVYLLNEDGDVCDGTYYQGRMGLWAGREAVDFTVSAVEHSEWSDEGEDVVGDVYYVMVQTMNGASSFRLRGYLPRTVAGSSDTADPSTLTRASIQVPAAAAKWKTIYGAPYGGAWDFTPTSQGTAYARLEYPADVASRILTQSTAQPASFEQYVYPSQWDTDSGTLPVSQPSDDSHWDLVGLNAHAGRAPYPGGEWYGLEGTFTVANAGEWTPGVKYHYVPVLWMVSSQPAQGPAAAPATGIRTVGYRATLLFPQNLRVAKATRSVRLGGRATFKGTLALPASAEVSAAVAWAPAGTRLYLQRKVSGSWRTVKTVTVGADGLWTARVRPRFTAVWRAWWPGDGTLRAESSLRVTVRVRR